MGSPTDRKYTDTHEWIMLNSNPTSPARTGITAYLAKRLGNTTSITLPNIGTNATQFQTIGQITGANSTHDFHSPVGGSIPDRDEILLDTPGVIGADPYGNGWLVDITPADATQMNNLMTADQYDAKYPL